MNAQEGNPAQEWGSIQVSDVSLQGRALVVGGTGNAGKQGFEQRLQARRGNFPKSGLLKRGFTKLG